LLYTADLELLNEFGGTVGAQLDERQVVEDGVTGGRIQRESSQYISQRAVRAFFD